MVPIGDLAQRGARLFGGKPALMVRKGKVYSPISYLQLAERVEQLSDGLLGLGLAKGDRVGVLGENRPEWAMAYLAIHRAGGIVVPMDSQLKEQELRHILDDSGTKYVIASQGHLSDVMEVAPKVPSLVRIICMSKVPEKGIECLDSLVGMSAQRETKASPSLADLAVILYTSGTTGFSKAVMLSHRNIMSNVSSLARAIPFTPEDIFLSILPLYHTLEATGGFLVPLFGGCSIAYARGLTSKEILEDIRDARASVILGIPLLYEKMHASMMRAIQSKPPLVRALFRTNLGLTKAMRGITGWNAGGILFKTVRRKAGLDSIKYFICGGAPLPKDVGRAFVNLGFTFLQGYGMTESSPVLTLNRPGKAKPESIGFPIPDVEIKLENPDERGVGELVAKGPNIMMGYYKNPQATSLAIQDGWLYTGDLARKDKEGYYYITGRSKNLIVSAAGKNIYPEEVEAQLLKSPYIAEVMVLGFQNSQTKREEVQAIIYPNSETLDSYAKANHKTLTPEDVERIIGDEVHKQCIELADYKRVKKFQLRSEEFPKTAIKKIKRYLVAGKAVAVKGESPKT